LISHPKAFETTDGSMVVMPCLNVIRMHVMIIVLACLGAARAAGAQHARSAGVYRRWGSVARLIVTLRLTPSTRATPNLPA
jgi:hypothetical protein